MLKENNKIKFRKRLPGILFKTALVIAALVVFYFIFTLALFYYFKDEIRAAVLARFNSKIDGNISFSDMSFSPLKYFPDISIDFNDLKLTGNPDSDSTVVDTVFSFSNVYCSVNVIDLLSSRINVPKVSIEQGYFNLTVFKDGTTNIANALRKKITAPIVKKPSFKKGPSKPEVHKKEPFELNLNIDQLSLSDINIKAHNQLTDNKLGIVINNYDSRIKYSKKYVFTDFTLDAAIDSLILKDKLILNNKNLTIDSRIDIEPESEFVVVDSSRITFEEAKFAFIGSFDLKNQGYIDLSISGKDITSGILSLFLRDTGKKSLKKGTAEFTATIMGKTLTELPLVEMDLLLTDVSLVNPVTKRLIRNLNLNASFTSGTKSDLSESIVVVDTLYADFPDGIIRLSGKAKNFKSPELDINLFLDADVTGLDDVFKINALDELKGRVKINQRYKGRYIPENKKVITVVNNLDIYLTGFALSIPGTIKFDKIDGTITRRNDNYVLKDLRIIYKDTDLLVNGELSNLHYLFFGIDKDLTAKLNVTAPVFNPAEFLFFDPSIKRDFPYRVRDLDLSVTANTTTFKCLNFKSFPEIDFDIRKLHATLEDFLPRIKISSGRFAISENILGFNLKLNKFRTEFLGGRFNFTGEYNSSRYQKYYIKLKTDFTDISPSVLFSSANDTVPELLSGKLSGSFFTEFQFPEDSLVLKFINLREGNITYIYSKDTITTKNLGFNFSSIYFNDKINPNPLATLSTGGNLKTDLIRSKGFKFSDLKLDINVVKGSYELVSNKIKFLGEGSRGSSRITLKPFAEIPSFNIKINANNFYAEKMLAAYMVEETISGPLSLSINLNSQGMDKEKIIENLQGNINLSGNNLTFVGLDADKLIEKFQRSQSFNLVDLGGVLLAGPVGLVVTKGTDFARLLVLNPGESTKVNKLVSNWTIKKGVFKIEDAAFTTNENRFALKGWIALASDSLDLDIALLDKYGCSVFLQKVYGKFGSPVMGKVEVFGTLAAPVTNLYQDVFGSDCVPFYTGSVKHPKK